MCCSVTTSHLCHLRVSLLTGDDFQECSSNSQTTAAELWLTVRTSVCTLQTLQMFESLHIKAEGCANQITKPKGVQPVKALEKEGVWPIRAQEPEGTRPIRQSLIGVLHHSVNRISGTE